MYLFIYFDIIFYLIVLPVELPIVLHCLGLIKVLGLSKSSNRTKPSLRKSSEGPGAKPGTDQQLAGASAEASTSSEAQ